MLATIMRTRSVLPLLICAAFALAPAHSGAVELTGKVRSVSGETVVVAIDGESLPNLGDKAEVYYKLPGVEEEISVATGKVEKVEGESIQLKVESAIGQLAKDQLVRV